MFDRLSQLRNISTYYNNAYGNYDHRTLRHYLAEVDKIKNNCNILNSCSESLEKLKSFAISANTPEEEAETSRRLDGLLLMGRQTIEVVTNQLTQLKNDNVLFCNAQGDDDQCQIRVNLEKVCLRKFRESLSRFWHRHEGFQAALRSKAEQQLGMMYPGKSAAEITGMLDAGCTNEQSQLLKDRCLDLQKLQKSVEELNFCFQQFRTLIQLQSQIGGDVECSIGNTKQATETGYHRVTEASALITRRRQTTMLWRLPLLIIIGLFVGYVLIFVFKLHKLMGFNF
eukprot:Platyproteum_vivax@DN2411_c0_g1_i1.p1